MTEESGDQPTVEPASGGNQGIRDLIERAFLVGMGAAALTKDRLQSTIDEFVRRGQLSGEDGREMVEKLVARSKEEARSAIHRADWSMQGTYRNLGLVAKREFEDVDLRIRQLEHRVQLLETAVDEGKPAG